MPIDDATLRIRARTLASRLEPLIGQVYFSPECHAAYEKLGFAPSPGQLAGVAMPDGPAYFTSRGSLLGQVEPQVVAAAFGVFKPAVVADGVRHGWSLTDADTIFAARRDGAVAQLERVLGAPNDQLGRAIELLYRTVDPLRPEGRPLFAGLRSRWDDPVAAWTRFFHLGDMLREFRGDAHVAAWTSMELDAVQIGLLTEAYIALPLRTYIRTRAWDDRELDAAEARLVARGWMHDGALTDDGRAGREAIETATDRALRPALDVLGDGADELFSILEPWGAAMREAGGYITGPVDLWPVDRR
ncbi:MAG: SCO6745 family protein [Acidimicrobiia bacterium]